MSMFQSDEQTQNWLTNPVSGIEGLGLSSDSPNWSSIEINQPNREYIGKWLRYADVAYYSTSQCADLLNKYMNKHNTNDRDILLKQVAAEVANDMRLTLDEAKNIGGHGDRYQLFLQNTALNFCKALSSANDAGNNNDVTIPKEVGGKTKTDSGTQTSSSGFVMPKWGWPAIIGAAVVVGYFVFRGK